MWVSCKSLTMRVKTVCSPVTDLGKSGEINFLFPVLNFSLVHISLGRGQWPHPLCCHLPVIQHPNLRPFLSSYHPFQNTSVALGYQTTWSSHTRCTHYPGYSGFGVLGHHTRVVRQLMLPLSWSLTLEQFTSKCCAVTSSDAGCKHQVSTIFCSSFSRVPPLDPVKEQFTHIDISQIIIGDIGIFSGISSNISLQTSTCCAFQ